MRGGGEDDSVGEAVRELWFGEGIEGAGDVVGIVERLGFGGLLMDLGLLPS